MENVIKRMIYSIIVAINSIFKQFQNKTEFDEKMLENNIKKEENTCFLQSQFIVLP